MSKLVTLCALFCLIMSEKVIGQTVKACHIIGNIKGLGNQTVTFFYEQQGIQRRDTVRAVNDHFSYLAKPSDDGIINLQLIPQRFSTIWYEPGTITVAGTMSNAGHLTALGTLENQVSTEHNQQVEWQFEQRMQAHPDSMQALEAQNRKATLAFIKAHPKARTSAWLLGWQMRYDATPIEQYEQLQHLLSPDVQASLQGTDAAKRLTILKNQPIVGRKAPDFTMPDTAGVAVSLSRFRGQYVVLDFWGHWCGPCIKAIPHLKRLQTQYASQVQVIGIGMEAADDKQIWQQTIRKQQIPWLQLSDLKGDKGVIEQYNINAFPTYLLLDQQGIVVERTSDLAVLEQKLKTLSPKP
ncbi:TlpA disulfide reductase family protein [Hymenobacter sp. GOD-10R]|uniref:TlpA disulfide reductase family protein n=1 Tax=Hymenobacter sp. GOD-10R TaxID=3093922 RepID=UPI002D778AB3|nr:TlpA disulfide reductase family protein [Hymenobacter sp. GOD-10R]WRQ31023.1 TlpA disulfide reductase family protein [Hymenobacter sp. GOD-10R]